MTRKRFNPFRTVTLKKAKVNGVKCWTKVLQKKVVNQVRKPDGRYVDTVVGYEPISWFVGASDGSNMKVNSEEKALVRFEQLIEFEKKTTTN